MIRKTILAVAAIAAFGAMQASTASAAPLGSLARQHTFKKSVAPLQFQLFCLDNPSQCKAGGPSQISYTPKIKNLVSSVNAQVNRQIKPRNEKVDVWKVAVGANVEGDCDDYVMTKRARLIRAGVPASALRIAMVRTQRGTGHAVLLVKTSSGEYVLDNIRKTIVKREQSGYRYVRVSGANPMQWN